MKCRFSFLHYFIVLVAATHSPLPSAAQNTGRVNASGFRDPTETDQMLQREFERIFVDWESNPDETGFTRLEINRENEKKGSHYFSGISFRVPRDAEERDYEIEFYFAPAGEGGRMPIVRGFNFITESGKTRSTLSLKSRVPDEYFRKTVAESSPIVNVLTPDDLMEPGKRYALWFAFKTSFPVTIGARITALEKRPAHREFVDKDNATPSALSELKQRISRHAAVETADFLPIQEEVELDERGYGKLHIVEFEEENQFGGESGAGFRVRIPDPIPGDLLYWYFDPDAPTERRQRTSQSIGGRSIGSVSIDSFSDKVSASSLFRRIYPKNTDPHLRLKKFQTKWMIPGEVYQVVFRKSRPDQKRIAFAYSFTDGIENAPSTYLPIYVAKPFAR